MSTTETDFWSRIDSEPTADEPQQSSNETLQFSDNEADSGAAESGETESSESESSESESSESESSESESSESESSESSDRESLIPVATAAPAPELRVARPAESGSEKSKSQRIREFMAAHPEVRNKDIVDALAEYGVTAADVSNVRTQIRKKAEKQQKAKARVESSVAPRTPAGPRTARDSAAVAARGGASSAKSDATPAAGEIAMTEIEAGLTFIEQAGSLERARQVVELIARIREISLNR